MVAQTRHTGQASPKKLAFREKLVAKGQSNDALLKKLKTLHSELAEMDQELVDVNSLSNVRKELIGTSILLHKDRGVKAYAACCIADILRLYAPDAPYTQNELRDIFQFFFKQLTNNLKKSDDAYYSQYFHLLESLSTVKSVVLVCDLPSADELTMGIFRDLFAIVRRELPIKIESFMAEILVAIVDESSSLSGDILETIMAQFMDKNARVEQPAYRLAVQVCNQTADKLQRNVALYFTDIIVSNSQEEDFEQIRIAHDLIRRLHASCPGLLPSVIPQLEEELQADTSTLRAISTQILGEMFSDKTGGDLAKNHPSTWSTWLNRKVDKSPAVRLKFVEAAKGLYTALPEMVEAIESALKTKLVDPDEKIRAAACKVYSQLDYETVLHHVSEEQIRTLAVRFEAANSVAKIYSLAYPEIENNDVTAVSKFSWIPNELLTMSGSITDARPVVEQVLAEHILPLPAYTPNQQNGKTADVDEVAWTDRVLNVMRYLSEQGVKALVTLANIKPARPTAIDVFLETCVKYNGGIVDEDEEKVTQMLTRIIGVVSAGFSDPAKVKEDLKSFANVNESRLYRLLRTCMDVDTDLKGLVKAHYDFLKRLESSSSLLVSSMTALLRRNSLYIVNSSSIFTLLRRVQKAQGSAITKTNLAAKHASVLLMQIAKFCPALFKPHVGELILVVEDGKNDIAVSVGLQGLASVVKLDPAFIPSESPTVDTLRTHALGSNSRHSKYATRYFAFGEDKNEVCNELVETIAESLNDVSEEHLVARLVSLSQLARFVPDAFEQKSDVVTQFLLKKLLMIPSLPPVGHLSPIFPPGYLNVNRAQAGQEDDGEEWIEDEDVSNNLRAKVVALKLFRHRCVAHADSKNSIEIATPVLKMLTTITLQAGSIRSNNEVEEDRKALSRIRLQAAVSLLYLSTVPVFADALAPQFIQIALTIQDTCFNVRQGFLRKIIPLLYARKLPAKYHLILFLTAHDPEEDIKQIAAKAAGSLLNKYPPNLRTENLEYVFIRFLHLLAHHPDFATSQSELQDIAKYVQFYLELVGSEETISLLYHLASKGKTNLYAMCELAQELIKLRAQHYNWTIPTYPGKVKLPADILRPHPNAETANKIAKRTFLPLDAQTWLEAVSNAAPKEKKERKPATKRKAPAATNGHTKRFRKKRKQADSSDGEQFDHTDVTDVEMSDPPTTPAPDEMEEEESGGEEKLGRGARGKAKVLLGYKKRGFGSHKYNGFGGKVEPGETSLEAAARELEEEAGINSDLQHVGVLFFLSEGEETAFHIDIYRGDGFEGTVTETEEMRPEWFSTGDLQGPSAIPYDSLWESDPYWFPLLLSKTPFRGRADYQKDSKEEKLLPSILNSDHHHHHRLLRRDTTHSHSFSHLTIYMASLNPAGWSTIRPWIPPLSLSVREITSVSVTFVLSAASSDPDADANLSLSALGISTEDLQEDEDDGYDEDTSASESEPKKSMSVVASALAGGLSVEVDRSSWRRVFIRIDDKADEAVIIVYGLMPGRQYEIVLELVQGGQTNSIRQQVTTEDTDPKDASHPSETEVAHKSVTPAAASGSGGGGGENNGPSTTPRPTTPDNSTTVPQPATSPGYGFAPLTLEDRITQLQHTLSLLNSEQSSVNAAIKTSRRDAQKADANLRSEIEALKRASERYLSSEQRSKQKVLALQEAVKRTQMSSKEMEASLEEVNRQLPGLNEGKHEKEEEHKKVTEEANRVGREKDEEEEQERKRIEVMKNEMNALVKQLEKLETKKEKLESTVIKELEEQLENVELEMEMLEKAQEEALSTPTYSQPSASAIVGPAWTSAGLSPRVPEDDLAKSLAAAASRSPPTGSPSTRGMFPTSLMTNPQWTPITSPPRQSSQKNPTSPTRSSSLPQPNQHSSHQSPHYLHHHHHHYSHSHPYSHPQLTTNNSSNTAIAARPPPPPPQPPLPLQSSPMILTNPNRQQNINIRNTPGGSGSSSGFGGGGGGGGLPTSSHAIDLSPGMMFIPPGMMSMSIPNAPPLSSSATTALSGRAPPFEPGRGIVRRSSSRSGTRVVGL
ncbi:hypothetical protein D9757_003848 [Collybiopsis confluens]|uniref:Oxidized purine nucleoside triphosphate hydrolase n=1 Tax=Collybiopsis confluens TaxID=2823264 RepID=A0A8H5HVT1_9AGAR|nr:hypothetical protein D9757_003848 [Collybiopsis confluens]